MKTCPVCIKPGSGTARRELRERTDKERYYVNVVEGAEQVELGSRNHFPGIKGHGSSTWQGRFTLSDGKVVVGFSGFQYFHEYREEANPSGDPCVHGHPTNYYPTNAVKQAPIPLGMIGGTFLQGRA